jgi:hypothetical protein
VEGQKDGEKANVYIPTSTVFAMTRLDCPDSKSFRFVLSIPIWRPRF